MRRKGKLLMHFLLSMFTVILLVVVIVIAYLLFIGKGQVEQFTDESGNIIPGSVAEKIMVDINGIDQGMFIRGIDSNNPVLLFVHGGPGVPEFFLNETWQTDLEKYFTVCWWEARGSGLSYDKNHDISSITTQQLVEDAIHVTEYLSNRFGKDKIYLMGHSFGTLIGIQAAAHRPDLYQAYIGMSQAVGNDLSGAISNTLTYNYMADIFTAWNDKTSLNKLDMWSVKHDDGTVTFNQNALSQLDDLKHKAGCGTMHSMDSVITGIFLPQMNSRCYTLPEKIDYWCGKALMQSTVLYEEMLTINLFEQVLSLEIPVYFFSGIYDYTCPYPLSLEYFEALTTPLKGFYTFDNSAHSPLWEEPDKTVEVLVEDVLKETIKLSDQ